MDSQSADLQETSNQASRLYGPIAIGILVLCVAPFVASFFGVDFGSPTPDLDPETLSQVDPAQRAGWVQGELSGAFAHTILEWSAVRAAFVAALLALAHYRIANSVVTPVIGSALFMAGCMDAFHILAAARLVGSPASAETFIPFTWAISRAFNALIMILGVALVFGASAWAIIQACASSQSLPQTMSPEPTRRRRAPRPLLPPGRFPPG